MNVLHEISSSSGDFCSCGFLRKNFARCEWKKISEIHAISQGKKYEYHHFLEIRHTRLSSYRLGNTIDCDNVLSMRTDNTELFNMLVFGDI